MIGNYNLFNWNFDGQFCTSIICTYSYADLLKISKTYTSKTTNRHVVQL
jgi:hypothetical protein